MRRERFAIIFFAVGNRALIRDNGVSRLWWLGKIAYDVAPDEPRKFLTILLHRQDVRSALIERPSVSRNPGLLRGIFRVMARHWNNGGALFKREAFRSWMVALDRRGGVILLDTLPEHTLNDLLNEEANFAIESFSEAMINAESLRRDSAGFGASSSKLTKVVTSFRPPT